MIVEGSRRQRLIFQIYVTIICSPLLLILIISLDILVNEGDFSHPAAYAFLTTSVHVPLDSVFNQIW